MSDTPFILPFTTYFKKLLACYIGKAAGGTLGMPFEGNTGVRAVSYYDPVPTAMAGNDDVDLQVVWVDCLRRNGFPVNRKHLADAWRHIRFGPDEYAVAIHNIQNSLFAPLSGWYGNKFSAGMGAAIRSELWAALAPGDPDLAVSLAREDACVDHCEDGVEACAFLTAVESAAYTQNDIDTLIDIALSYIPVDSRLARGLRDTRQWWRESGSWEAVRERILEVYGTANWTDVTINLCFILLAWLAGENDFGKSICLAVDMGYDTDCTAATLGSIMAILYPDSIEERWTAPIGRRIVLSPQIAGIRAAGTIDELCSQIARLAHAAEEYYGSSVRITEIPGDLEQNSLPIPVWSKMPEPVMLAKDYCVRESLVALYPVILNLVYPDSVALMPHEWSLFSADVANPTEQDMQLDIQLRVPHGFETDLASICLKLGAYEKKSFDFSVLFRQISKKAFEQLDFVVTANGIPYVVSAGLPTAYPWVHKAVAYTSKTCPPRDVLAGAQLQPAGSVIQPVAPGCHLYAIDVKSNMPQQVAVVCAGTCPLRMWLNEELLHQYDGNFYVPAVHRGPSVRGKLDAGWNHIVIAAESKCAGELFFAIGNPADWTWVSGLEWRAAAAFEDGYVNEKC